MRSPGDSSRGSANEEQHVAAACQEVSWVEHIELPGQEGAEGAHPRLLEVAVRVEDRLHLQGVRSVLALPSQRLVHALPRVEELAVLEVAGMRKAST